MILPLFLITLPRTAKSQDIFPTAKPLPDRNQGEVI
jgi:hypothetical protein